MRPILVNDKTQVEALYNLAAPTNHHEVSLYGYLDRNPAIKEVFRQNLAAIQGESPNTFDYEGYINASLVCQGINYIPKIKVFNFQHMNTQLSPRIAIGSQINEDKYPAYPDHILSWVCNSGHCQIQPLGLEESRSTSNPVLIFVNGKDLNNHETFTPIENIQFNPEEDIPGHGNKISTIKYYHNIFSIPYKYEESGDIEYAVDRVSAASGYMSSSGISSFIKSVHPSQIGTTITFSKTIYILEPTAYATNVDLATYEFDWYGALQQTGICHEFDPVDPDVSPGCHSYRAKRKYEHEWYHFHVWTDPCGYSWEAFHPNNYDTRTNYGKGFMKTWRIDS